MPYILNDQPVTSDFEVAEVRYPANVLTLWPREELKAIGLVWVDPEPAPVDWISPARQALDASDVTILRCVECGIAVPEAWADYRQALRDVVRLGEGPLPTRPAWP
ncbi:hypothetical protein [Brevundimonas sp. SL161]|uniref:hypothetical protein n=1 Tax=Brevundimonas sp. SL161 TaxID=2804613 RepID=UPI003CE88594